MRLWGTSSGSESGPVTVILLLALCVLLLTAGAHPAPTAVPAKGEDDGMPVLRDAADAEGEVAYTAVRELRGPEGALRDGLDVRVVNRPGEGLAMSPTGTEEGAFVVRDSSDLDTLDERLLAMLEETYMVTDVGVDAIGGRRARLVEARRSDSTVAGRFWVDSETALLLGRVVYDRAEEVAFSSRLTDLRFDTEGWPENAEGGSPWGDDLDHGERNRLRDAGWELPEYLTWNLRLVDARSTDHGGERVVHTIYSDGLSQISVFSQRGKLGEAHPSTDRNGYAGTGTGGEGVTRGHETIFGGGVGQYQSMWQADGFVYTVLADAPAGLASSAVTALPGPEESSGFWPRVRRGLSRLGLV